MISLHRRIVLGSVGLTALVVGVAVVAVFAIARWQAVEALDRELAQHAQRLRYIALRGPPPGHPRPDHQPPGDERRGPGGPGGPGEPNPPGWDGEKRRLFIDITDAGGGRSLMRPADSPELASLLADLPDDVPAWRTLEDGRRLRAMRTTVTTTDDAFLPPMQEGDWSEPTRQIRGNFAIDASALGAEQARLGATLFAVWATATLLALLAARWLRRSVIGPLDRLAADLRGIDPERLDGRVDEGGPQEMAPAVRLLNELLDQLVRLREREKGTIASIAHELRSPVSGLRTALEVAALDRSASAPELAGRLLPTVVAMHAMIANLLALARLEAGQERLDLQEVDLDALLALCWGQVQTAASGRGMRLRQEGGRLGTVQSCPDKLRMVVGNLLDNAVTHAPDGAEIELRCTRADGTATLEVLNPITGPPPDLQQVFTPFWRGDRARSSPQHCGLGLALARRLSHLLVAELTVELPGDGRFLARLAIRGQAAQA